MAWLQASDSGKESMSGRTRERYYSHRSQDPHQSRSEGSSGLAPVARHSQGVLRVREYHLYEPQRSCIESSLQSRARMEDASDFTEVRAGQVYVNLLLGKLR